MNAAKQSSKQRITFERHYKGATSSDVWELWTTKEGIEEWWGPDGFSVTVHTLELRPGGILDYTMTATAPPQVEFMKKAGMPLANRQSGNFTEVEPERLLAFEMRASFIPGVEPYSVGTSVEIFPTADGVRLLVTLDPMHDAYWTEMSAKGMEGELGRLERVLAKRTARAS